MRLWHEALIPYLPRQQLLGQHRECCALRGLGWGKKHATVNYVFQHPFWELVEYHYLVIHEMLNRGYNVNPIWEHPYYRGKKLGFLHDGISYANAPVVDFAFELLNDALSKDRLNIYPEHDSAYLQECLDNLAGKGIHIDMEVKK